MHVRRRSFLWLTLPIVFVLGAAYLQWAIAGLPRRRATIHSIPRRGRPGFPMWVCITHYINLLLLVVFVRSGLQILMDHPRLYWNVGCAPRTEWIRFTPIEVPTDRLWTAKDDARYLSPWIGLPGGRHTLGLSRHWHFVSALFWILNGGAFIILLFATGQWRRLVPTSWQIVPDAWSIFVHYATFHWPAEPNGYYAYNALQQLAYFGVVFILAPLQIISAGAMSPALVNRFAWYPKLPGNRQVGRSLHFLFACAFLAFTIPHVGLVASTGFVRNMNHITVNRDDLRMTGVYLGLAGLVVIVLLNVFASSASPRRSRLVQRVGEAVLNPVLRLVSGRGGAASAYTKEDISPYFWVNGKMPTSREWEALADGDFESYRLKVSGLVENPVELSLAELQALGDKTQITLHNCIQGWSGIAAWTGVPMKNLLELVRPKLNAKVMVFYSFGEGGEGGEYYDSQTLAHMRHPQAMLAYGMNYAALSHEHGAPLRLRVEDQLGFKMVKWIRAIELVEDAKQIHQGEGGYNEDNEYFDSMADI